MRIFHSCISSKFSTLILRSSDEAVGAFQRHFNLVSALGQNKKFKKIWCRCMEITMDEAALFLAYNCSTISLSFCLFHGF
jgi:hypothetical protein